MTFRPGQTVTVNSRKYDGTIRRSWNCEFVGSGAGCIDLVGSFEVAVEHPELGRVEEGTVSRERFYTNRWYNYFIFEHPAGTLRNYYFNICMPPTVGDGVIDYVDLDIDVILWPDGRVETLDIDEFRANAQAFGYSEEVQERALQTLEAIQSAISNNSDVHRAVARL